MRPTRDMSPRNLLSPVSSVPVSVFPVSVHGLLFPVSSVQRLLSPVVSTVHRPRFPSTVHGLLFPVFTLRKHPPVYSVLDGISTVHGNTNNPARAGGVWVRSTGPWGWVSTVHCFLFPLSTVYTVHGFLSPRSPSTVSGSVSTVHSFHCPRFPVHSFHCPLSTVYTVHGFQTVTCSFPSPLPPSFFSSAPTSDPRPSAWGCLRVSPRVFPRMFPQAPG